MCVYVCMYRPPNSSASAAMLSSTFCHAARRCSSSSSSEEESELSSPKPSRPGKAMETCPEATPTGQNAKKWDRAFWCECKSGRFSPFLAVDQPTVWFECKLWQRALQNRWFASRFGFVTRPTVVVWWGECIDCARAPCPGSISRREKPETSPPTVGFFFLNEGRGTNAP